MRRTGSKWPIWNSGLPGAYTDFLFQLLYWFGLPHFAFTLPVNCLQSSAKIGSSNIARSLEEWPTRPVGLNAAQEHQNQDDHEDSPKSTARRVPPLPTVRPGRYRTEDKKNQDQ